MDIHLRPSIKDLDQVDKIITRSSELGYSFVGVSLPHDATLHEIHMLQKICSDRGIDLVTRVDVAPKTPRELLNFLRRFRRRFEIIAVTSISKPVARQAAKDRRVDLLLFPTDPRKRFFDPAEAELASKALASFEINMTPLLSLKGVSRIRLLSCLRREAEIAKRFDVAIVLSSGATNEYFLRTPQDYSSLAKLFDLSQPKGLCALSENPMAIIDRNRKKLSPEYVAPGIRIIKRGKA